MRNWKLTVVVGMVAILLTADAWAQGRGRGGFGRVSRLGLLGVEKVQQELDLSDDQIKSVQAMRDAARANEPKLNRDPWLRPSGRRDLRRVAPRRRCLCVQ